MIKTVFSTSLRWQFIFSGAVRRNLYTSGRASMFEEDDRETTKYSFYEYWQEGIKMVGPEMSKFKEEVINTLQCDNWKGIQHGDYELLWKFDNKELISSWIATADQDNNQGHSTAEFVITPNNRGLFRGCIDTTVPKDGVIKRTGYCNIRSPPNFVRSSFFSQKCVWHTRCKTTTLYYSVDYLDLWCSKYCS